MGRRAHNVHLKVGEEIRESAYSHEKGATNTWIKLACGEETIGQIKTNSEDPTRVSCPKCSAKVYGEKIKDANVTLERADPKDVRSYVSIKSLYRVMVEGAHVGWAVYANGYGGSWKLYPIEFNLDGAQVIPRDAGDGLNSKTLGWRGFGSKEHALFEAIALRAEGKLPSVEEREIERKNIEKRFNEQEAERRSVAAARKLERDNTIEGLQSILDDKILTFTNFQREALANAIKMLS